jgi:hypothetical protein
MNTHPQRRCRAGVRHSLYRIAFASACCLAAASAQAALIIDSSFRRVESFLLIESPPGPGDQVVRESSSPGVFNERASAFLNLGPGAQISAITEQISDIAPTGFSMSASSLAIRDDPFVGLEGISSMVALSSSNFQVNFTLTTAFDFVGIAILTQTDAVFSFANFDLEEDGVGSIVQGSARDNNRFDFSGRLEPGHYSFSSQAFVGLNLVSTRSIDALALVDFFLTPVDDVPPPQGVPEPGTSALLVIAWGAWAARRHGRRAAPRLRG